MRIRPEEEKVPNLRQMPESPGTRKEPSKEGRRKRDSGLRGGPPENSRGGRNAQKEGRRDAGKRNDQEGTQKERPKNAHKRNDRKEGEVGGVKRNKERLEGDAKGTAPRNHLKECPKGRGLRRNREKALFRGLGNGGKKGNRSGTAQREHLKECPN